jgi:hypothetical protein
LSHTWLQEIVRIAANARAPSSPPSSWCPDDERSEILDARVVWHPAGAAEPLVIDLLSLFRDICGTDT